MHSAVVISFQVVARRDGCSKVHSRRILYSIFLVQQPLSTGPVTWGAGEGMGGLRGGDRGHLEGNKKMRCARYRPIIRASWDCRGRVIKKTPSHGVLSVRHPGGSLNQGGYLNVLCSAPPRILGGGWVLKMMVCRRRR